MYVFVVGVSSALFLFIISCVWIGFEVKQQCFTAKQEYGGDCVEALAAVLRDESKPYGQRNSAIWALGQLGDNRALPGLETYYTGNIPAREPWNGVMSQYELKKAINLARGGTNIGAWVWRYDIDDKLP